MKPWTYADRWDDETRIQGHEEWQGNWFWDSEAFTDLDESGIREPGEPFQDANGNGRYDAEFYDPEITGFRASTDLGLQVTFRFTSPFDPPLRNALFPTDLPLTEQPDVGAGRFRWNIANCNTNLISAGMILDLEGGAMSGPSRIGLLEIQNQDLSARWDDACDWIADSEFPQSPRLLFVTLHDPRISPARGSVLVRKIGALFLESVGDDGTIVARLAASRMADGVDCPGGAPDDEGFVFDCPEPVPTHPVTWGRIKSDRR